MVDKAKRALAVKVMDSVIETHLESMRLDASLQTLVERKLKLDERYSQGLLTTKKLIKQKHKLFSEYRFELLTFLIGIGDKYYLSLPSMIAGMLRDYGQSMPREAREQLEDEMEKMTKALSMPRHVRERLEMECHERIYRLIQKYKTH